MSNGRDSLEIDFKFLFEFDDDGMWCHKNERISINGNCSVDFCLNSDKVLCGRDVVVDAMCLIDSYSYFQETMVDDMFDAAQDYYETLLDDEEDDDYNDDEGLDTDIESNVDKDLESGKHKARKKTGNMAETDEDGYMKFSMPWSLTFGYGITMRETTSGKFNKKRMRYPYSFSQTLNVSGNVRISDGWNISFSSGYDFENHDISMTTASLSRDLHCFNMSASVVLAPYTSYNFTFRCNASTLTDALKYDKRSGISNAVQWY